MHKKTCSKCSLTKSIAEFWKERDGLYGVHSICKICKHAMRQEWANKNREHFNAYMRKYNAEHPKSLASKKRAAERVAKCRYGITEKQRLEMFEKQNGTCFICSRSKKLVIDHDHFTGKVRGLLCYSCNQGMRLIDDEVLFARSMQFKLSVPR